MQEQAGSAGLLFEGKNSAYEGGMREPCIVRWPGKVKAGAVSQALMSSMDFFPTLAALTKTALPPEKIYDGYDMSDVWLGKKEKAREILPYYINDELYALRKGPWKIHFVIHASFSPVPPQVLTTPLLYNIDNDPSEKYNVAKEYPDALADLTKEFEKQRTSVPIPLSEIEKSLPEEKKQYLGKNKINFMQSPAEPLIYRNFNLIQRSVINRYRHEQHSEARLDGHYRNPNC